MGRSSSVGRQPRSRSSAHALCAAAAGTLLLLGCAGEPSETPHVSRLGFRTHPGLEEGQVAFDPPIVVELQDASGEIVPGASQNVTLRLTATPVGARLSGTTTVPAVDGIATFSNVHVALPGDGFALEARVEGASIATSSPFAVRLSFTSVSVGSAHSCGLTVAGYAYCWGGNPAGQIGDSTTAPRVSPVPVAGRRRFTQLSTGDLHTCAVTAEHVAYCWGFNEYGRLGDGTTATQRETPTPVAEGLPFAQVSAGAVHTCGVTVTGDPYCWGFNDHGQVGDPQIGQYRGPIPVAGDVRFTEVSAGGTHTCGLTADSTAYCWGNNDVGQLGDSGSSSTTAPTPVSGGLRFRRLVAGGIHTCGVTVDRALYCWGFNNHGQLGDGTTTERHAPTLITAGASVEDVSAGYTYTCAVATGGTAYCWGMNFDGQVGDGTTQTPRLSPTPVAGGLTFAAVSAHNAHTCGLTLERIVYCWGAAGAIGNGTENGSLTPTRVVQ